MRFGRLARHPQVCLIDGLAYDNPPGSRHGKRYEDVEELLNTGISIVRHQINSSLHHRNNSDWSGSFADPHPRCRAYWNSGRRKSLVVVRHRGPEVSTESLAAASRVL